MSLEEGGGALSMWGGGDSLLRDEAANAKKIELDAKAWLFGESKDFQEICFRADLEPCYVIKLAKKIIRLNGLNNKCNELKVA